jgi:hypothetical protein
MFLQQPMISPNYKKYFYLQLEYSQGFVGVLAAVSLLFISSVDVKAQEGPHYEADPSWPKLPLGDRWLTGGLGGICIDSQDHVYILNRQNVVPDDLDGAQLAPPVIELDPEGNVVGGWGDPEQLGDRLHDCHVDNNQNVWVVAAATGVLRKYSSDGNEMLLQLGESGQYDSTDGSRQGSPLNSDRAQFFLPAALDVDADTGDIYVADGELPGGNQRIAVLDRNGQFLRQWPLHRSDSERDIRPLPHCLRLSNDDLVYVCDREADRIQVFDQSGSFIRNIDLAFQPYTSPAGRPSGNRGSAVVLAFSPDPQQQFIFVVNQNSVMIDVVGRQSGQLLTSFGDGPGRYPGQFTLPHGIAVDSAGNVYVAEQEGRRIQKFRIVAPD